MKRKNPKNLSIIISISIHFILVLVLFFITVSAESEPSEYVTVGFGTYGNISKPGVKGESNKEKKPVTKPKPEKKNKIKKVKKVDLPKTKINKSESVITKKNKKNKKKMNKSGTDLKAARTKKKSKSSGKEESGTNDGNSGFKIDFGGKGIRKLYSYSLPKYPSGVSKEIDVKLRFSILPDGTVGKVFPLIKADANLESVSISSLRQWRFEPLSKTIKQIEQKAVIVFPYRLK